MGILYTPPTWGWAAVGGLLVIDAVFLVLGLATGGALAYGIHAFTQKPLLGGLLWMRISNTVFLAAVVWLIWLGARRVSRYQMRRDATLR